MKALLIPCLLALFSPFVLSSLPTKLSVLMASISEIDDEIKLTNSRVLALKQVRKELVGMSKKKKELDEGGTSEFTSDEIRDLVREIVESQGSAGGNSNNVAQPVAPAAPVAPQAPTYAAHSPFTHTFSSYFIPSSSIPLTTSATSAATIRQSDITTFALLAFKPKERAGARGSKKKGGNAPQDTGRVFNVLAVCTVDKMIFFYESDGTFISSYFATHVVQSVVFESSDVPVFVTAGSDGTLLFHNMTLWKNNVVLVGRKPKSVVVPNEFNENGTPKKVKFVPPESNKNGIALQIGLESVGDTCMSDAETCPAAKSLPKIEHMASHTPRGGGGGLSRKLIVADDTNTLRMYFSRNGTLGRTLDVGGAVTAMAKSGPSVALGVGGDVLFVSGTKMDKVILTCSGIIDTKITALQYDVLAPSFLYAGLSSGEVVVFNTKYRKEGSKEKSSCKVVHKAHDGAAVKGGAVDRLFGIKGYVMAGYSEDRAVSVWNTTEVRDVGAMNVIQKEVLSKNKGKGWDVKMSIGAGQKAENIMVAVMGDNGNVVLYEHLLPHSYHYGDISWMRLPLVVLGIGVVFFYNWFKKDNKAGRRGGNPFAGMEAMGGMGGMGGGGMDGLGADDMASLSKLQGVEGFDVGEFSKFMGGGAGAGGGSRGGGGGGARGMGGGGMGMPAGIGGLGGLGGGKGLSPGPKFGKGARFN